MNFNLVRGWRILSVALTLALSPSVMAADLVDLRIRAAQGDRKAFAELIAALNKGGKDEQREAFIWSTKQAETGTWEQKVMIGAAYEQGRPGVDREAGLVAAEIWYYRAFQQSTEATENLLVFYHRNSLATPAYRDAFIARLHELAEGGDADAQRWYALTLFEGVIVPKDEPAGVEWLRQSAEAGNIDAMMAHATALLTGRGVRQDQAAGTQLVIRAAEAGNADALGYLAEFYRDGIGVEKNLTTAASYFKQAADKGNTRAALLYALALHTGAGVPRDDARAAEIWVNLSLTVPHAAFNAGAAYRDGIGVAKDPAKAAAYFQRASDAGIPAATTALAELKRVMPVSYKLTSNVYLWAEKASKDGSGRFVQIYSFSGKAGNEITAKLAGGLDPWNARSSPKNLRLHFDDGSGKFQAATGLEHTIKLKQDGRVRFMATTGPVNHNDKGEISFFTTTPAAGGEPPVITHHNIFDLMLPPGGHLFVQVEQLDRRGMPTIRASADGWDPYIEVAKTGGRPGEVFKADQWDDNGGGGTTAKVSYSIGEEGWMWVRVTSRTPRKGGSFKLSVDNPLHWQKDR